MACYVISSPDLILLNKYKFGKTNQTRKQLETTYQRYLDGAKVLLFYETDTEDEDEDAILEHFREHRQKTSTGRLNEWLRIEFNILKDYLENYFAEKAKQGAKYKIQTLLDLLNSNLYKFDITPYNQIDVSEYSLKDLEKLFVENERNRCIICPNPAKDKLLVLFDDVWIVKDFDTIYEDLKDNNPSVNEKMTPAKIKKIFNKNMSIVDSLRNSTK